MNGRKVCTFAYGQTGSGKTYTMNGGDPETGHCFSHAARNIQDAGEREERNEMMYSLKMSMVEVYNETVRDLLTRAADHDTERKH